MSLLRMRRTLCTSASICGSPVLSVRSPDASAGAAARGAVPGAAVAPESAATGCSGERIGPLKRALAWKLRPFGAVSRSGTVMGARKWSATAASVVSNRLVSVCVRSAATPRSSWSSALRLAPITRPSPSTTTMPSSSVPMNSGRRWKCRRSRLP